MLSYKRSAHTQGRRAGVYYPNERHSYTYRIPIREARFISYIRVWWKVNILSINRIEKRGRSPTAAGVYEEDKIKTAASCEIEKLKIPQSSCKLG